MGFKKQKKLHFLYLVLALATSFYYKNKKVTIKRTGKKEMS